MKKYFYLLAVIIIILSSCGKDNNGIPEAQGGLLPSVYIYIKDNSFSPKDTSITNGNSIVFVNQTSNTQGLYSSDSIFINKQGIATNTSFFFKKDTVGTIYYFMAGKPGVNGTIRFTP